MVDVPRPYEHWINPWIDEYGDKLLAFAWPYTNDRDTAQDIVQEVFLRLYREHLRRPGRRIHPGWLYTVARRRAIDHHRKHRVFVLDKAPPAQAMDAAHLNLDIDSVLRELSNLDRELLLLFYYQDWPLSRLAEHYKIPVDTVKSRLHRARKRFRQLWNPDEEADDGTR